MYTYLNTTTQSLNSEQLLETLYLALMMDTGFNTDVTWTSKKVYSVTSEASESSK